MPSTSENERSVAPASGAGSEERLRESLKRCSAATVEAALCFQRTKDVAQIPTVVLGIIARFMEPTAAARLAEPDDDLRVMEDLGLDSLTLMEAIILVEEVLQVSINNDELRNLRTIGDIKIFIDHKVRGLPPPQPSRYLPLEAVAAAMPHQPPFLFVREATLSASWATGSYTVGGDEAFLAGHFKDNPIFPASIMLEALGQLAVLHLLQAPNSPFEQSVDPRSILFTGVDGVRCHRVCRPGDVLKLSVKPKRLRAPLAAFEGSIRVGQEKAVSVEEITLAFGFCTANPGDGNGASVPLVAPAG
jgi:3-hydroxymyristoyl/3-hydroxydecanoyl-(acyl carrier protein) dehydratase/acyl carrier protein